jgi:hypothetical protein
MLTTDYFAMLVVVRFPASIELSCRVKETTFTEARTQDTFLEAVAFLPVVSVPKQGALFLALFFYRAQFPRYRNNLHWDWSPGQVFGPVIVVPVIFLEKQKLWSWHCSFIVLSI